MFYEVKTFLNTTLKLEISEEKSGIHHAKEGTAFLGYVVKNFTTDKLLKTHRKDTRGDCRHEGQSWNDCTSVSQILH